MTRLDIDDVPECTACGACCFSELPEYVRVFGCDHDRMDDRARTFTEFRGNRCYMRVEGGRCAALVIDPIARRLTCAIYDARPDCCRSLERGGGSCRADRHEKAERPLVAIERLLAGAP
jgi:Fe-S-cluster containining protein